MTMIDVLAEVGAPHALFGGLLASHYGRERPTSDVDMIVPGQFCLPQNAAPLSAALDRRGYDLRHFTFLMKMYPRGEHVSVGDFVMLEANAVLRAALEAATPIEILGVRVNAVSRGVFIALKFEAAVAPRGRAVDRALHVADIRGVLEREFGPRDEEVAVEIAAKMRPGAVHDLHSLLDDLRRGRWPRVVRRAEVASALLRGRGLSLLSRRRS